MAGLHFRGCHLSDQAFRQVIFILQGCIADQVSAYNDHLRGFDEFHL